MQPKVKIVLALIVALAASTASAAAGPDPAEGSPDWYARAVANHEHSRGRGNDQLANPAYQAQFWPRVIDFARGNDPRQTRIATDPFREQWSPGRGTQVPVSYANRYGARIAANVWVPKLPFADPVTGVETSGPFPGVLLVSGTDAPQVQYLGMAQGLAEAGYVVMTFDPQGQGESDAQPDPASVYCDPNGAWRDPQELGVREEGSCAGARRSHTDGSALYDERYYLDQRLTGPTYPAWVSQYTRTHTRFILGAFDAVAWLLSEENPSRDLIDGERLGIVGHSIGAHTALNVGNGDPLGRFKAAVAWDTLGPMLGTVSPAIPTMMQFGDREEWFGPYTRTPDPDALPGTALVGRFRDADMDVSQIVLRGSTHQEWNYVPSALANPFCRPPQCTASRKGERVGLYFTAAWLDRYVKGIDAAIVRGDEAQQRDDARRRLLASSFDASIDGSSIGHGSWDPLAQRNVPYTIAGDAVREHLSVYYRSAYSVDGAETSDWRAVLESA